MTRIGLVTVVAMTAAALSSGCSRAAPSARDLPNMTVATGSAATSTPAPLPSATAEPTPSVSPTPTAESTTTAETTVVVEPAPPAAPPSDPPGTGADGVRPRGGEPPKPTDRAEKPVPDERDSTATRDGDHDDEDDEDARNDEDDDDHEVVKPDVRDQQDDD